MILEQWGATDQETASAVVGDELVPDARVSATRCITIRAAPESVFPWIRQMGFGRAGWYSYDLLDNLGRRSARRIHPEWQGIVPGSSVPAGPMSFEATIVDPPRAFVLSMAPSRREPRRINFTLAFELRAHAEGTRLVTRVRIRINAPGGRFIERFVLGPGDGLMVRKQLLNLKKRAESGQ